MNKVAEIFRLYKSLNITEIQKNTESLKDELDILLKELESLNPNDLDSLHRTQISDKILNMLEEIRINAQRYQAGFKINTSKIKIYQPIEMISEADIRKETYIKEAFTQFTDNIKKFETSIEEGKLFEEGEFLTIKRKIDEFMEELKQTKAKIIEITEKLRNDNDATIKSFAYEYNKDDINFVPDVVKTKKMINDSDSKHNFIIAIKALYSKLESKEIKERDFVQQYNEMVNLMNMTGLKVPNKLFNGKYTQRITNNLIMNEMDMKKKIQQLKEIVKDDSIVYTSTNPTLGSLEYIYSPNFTEMKSKSTGSADGSVANPLVGGNIGELKDKLIKLSDSVANYFEMSGIYKEQVKIYNKLQIQTLVHTLFLVLIVTNQLFTSGYVIYNYINRGTITFYIRIINNILTKINEGVTSDEILYFKKYHIVTLKKLSSFLNSLSQIEPSDTINVEECKGETSNRFLLLNYFKTHLESYHEQYQNAITIYARINDIKHTINPEDDIFYDEKMFLSDFERKKYIDSLKSSGKKTSFMTASTDYNMMTEEIDGRLMHVNTNACSALKHNAIVETYKFTEVFDSVQFTSNGMISKYMTLDTQLSKGKGVAIMTYGYSGTGKTFTLFGKHSESKEGILQSTLDSIIGLQSVRFRLFEIYGYGLAYPHYWTSDDGKARKEQISHEIYKYNIVLKSDSLSLEDEGVTRIDATGIDGYVNDHLTKEHTTYIPIRGGQISDIFRNFDMFMNEVENQRQGKKKNGDLIDTPESIMKRRIRDTPNNIVSSRSVLIYDFLLDVGGKDVPFLIIDLPGREEIVQTYINPFFDNNLILSLYANGLNKDPLNINYEVSVIKITLVLMALNPMAVPIFSPHIVFDHFNDLPDRMSIINAELNYIFDFDYNFYKKDNETPKEKTYFEKKYVITPDKLHNEKITGIRIDTSHRGFKLLEEIINRKGGDLQTFFKIENDKIIMDGDQKGYGYTKPSVNNYQYRAIIGIHIMNRLILMNRFDVINDIYKKIIKESINDKLEAGIKSTKDLDIKETFKNLQNSNFKGEIIDGILDNDKTIEKLIEVVKYDYYLTPLEGIYINENIAGLIKYLASNMITNVDDKRKMLELLEKDMRQPEGLNFQHQQKMARIWLMSKGAVIKKKGTINAITTGDIKSFYDIQSDDIPEPLMVINDKSVTFDPIALINNYEKLISSYKSHGIFNFENPLITNVLNPYLENIRDYKVFYLFGNYSTHENGNIRDLKCAHQNHLLRNTKNFIENISKN
jgi:hypothetical protein